MSSLTFVTAYLKAYDEEFDITRRFESRLKHFMSLLQLGINICIFIEPEFEENFRKLESEYPNLKVIQVMKVEDLELYKLCNENNLDYDLPINRNKDKDTKKYMFLILGKIEFTKKAIDINPYNSEYFSWIDFSLPYVFKDSENTLKKIKNISTLEFQSEFLYIPGCWNFKVNDIDYIRNNVIWRFCGGYFIGDKNSIVNFYNISNNYFLEFLNQTKTLSWEVNYWAWLEGTGLFSPTWYLADHNDSMIINMPNI